MSAERTLLAGIASVLTVAGSIAKADGGPRLFLGKLGWDLPTGVDDVGLAALELDRLGTRLAAWSAVETDPSASAADRSVALAELAEAAIELLHDLSELRLQAPQDYLDRTGIKDQFLTRLFDLYLVQAVATASRPVFDVAVLLGWFEMRAYEADPAIMQVAHVRHVVHWDRIPRLFTDPSALLGEVYGWGSAGFDPDVLVRNLGAVLQHVSHDLRHRALPAVPLARVLGRPPSAAGAPLLQVFCPLLGSGGPLTGEAGISVFGLPPTTDGGIDGGIGVAPYAEGTAALRLPLSSTLSLGMEAGADLGTGLALVLRPGTDPVLRTGLNLPEAGTAGPGASVQVDLTASRPPGTDPMTLLAAAGATLQATTIALVAGVAVDGSGADATVRLKVEGGRLALEPGGVPFLDAILPAGGIETAFDVDLSWSNRRGVRLDGRAGLKTSLAVGRTIGPVTIDVVDLALAASGQGLALTAGVGVTVTFDPVQLIVTGTGLQAAIGPGPGTLGSADLSVDFVAPDGIGLAIDAGLVQGGGFLRYDRATGRYGGAVQLQLGDIGVTGVGMVDTLLPGGAPGFALLVALRATFPGIQLGYGFSLTAVGGLLALNRRIDVDALRARFASGTAGRVLAPEDPIRNAPAILADLDAVFPVAQGVTVIGPTAQLVWAGLVHFDVGLFVELPGPSRVVLLGTARATIESGGRAYLVIRADIVGVVDLRQGTVAFDAVLVGSQLLEVLDLTGGAAFRLAVGDQPYAVLTVGGFHPAYNPEPLVFPSSLTRIAMVYGQPHDRLYLRFEGYFAVTTNTMQLGAAVEAVINAGNFNIQGILAFDALIQFDPFHFHVDIRAFVRVRYKSRKLAGLTLTGSLDGPGPVVLRAKVCIELLFFDICFSDTFTLGSSVPPPSTTVASGLDALAAEFDNPANLRVGDATDRHVVLRPPPPGSAPVVTPVGQLAWVQRRAPLGLLLQRIGGTPLAAPERVDATSPAATAPELDWFAPGSFTDLTDDDALQRPAFERLAGGLRLGAGAPVDGPSAQATVTVRQIRLPAKVEKPLLATTFPMWVVAATGRATGAKGPAVPVVAAVKVAEEAWTVIDPVSGDRTTGLSAAQAHQVVALTPGPSRPVATPTAGRMMEFVL